MFVTTSENVTHDKGSLSLWNTKNFQIENSLPVDPDTTVINCVSFNHNGSMFVTGGSDGMIRIYDTSFRAPVMGWNAHSGTDVLAAEFSYDETAVFSLGSDGKIMKWSMANIAHSLLTYDYDGLQKGLRRRGDIAFDGYGDHFIVGSKSNYGIIYKDDAAAPVQYVKGHSSPVVAVDWTRNADGASHCLTGSMDSTVILTKLDE